MIDLAWRPFALPLKHPFTIARGTIAVQDTLVVQVHEEGEFGYGEATANPFYGATIEGMSQSLARLAPLARGASADDPEPLLARAAAVLADDPAMAGILVREEWR